MDRPQNLAPSKWKMVSLALELGYVIAIPIVALGLSGKYLDDRLGVSPWFKIAGLLLAIAASTFWLSKRFQAILNDLKKEQKDKQKGQ